MTSKIVYDMNIMKFMSLFETLTRSKLKDCIVKDNLIIFIVQPGEMGKAIGKKGINVKKLEQMLKKKVKIVEYSTDIEQFIKNVIVPARIKEITYIDGTATLSAETTSDRGLIIGRDAAKLRSYEQIVKRYFPELKEIKVR